MTDDMLRLARAVYPDRPWQQTADGEVFEICRVYPFDPANNAGQFCDVLAWLTGGDDAQYAAADFRDRYLRVWNRTNPGYFEIDHDGTAYGIRAAVVQAARRVVEVWK